jgi:MFS family permease
MTTSPLKTASAHDQAPTITRGAAIVLLFASSLSVLAGAIVAPSLPVLRQVFASQDGINLLSRLVLTLPALGVAIGAPLVGVLVDRIGRRRVLLAGLVLYGASGTSGLWLDSLQGILVGRFILGFGIAAVMISATTLLADLTHGETRSKLMGIQSAFMGLGGILFMTTGGWLADMNWRWPFFAYFLGLMMIPGALITLNANKPKQEKFNQDETLPKQALFVYGFTIIGMLLFYLLPVQLPFLLSGHLGATGTQIGLSLGLMTAFGTTGSFLFARVQKVLGHQRMLLMNFIMMIPGLALIGWSTTWPGILLGIAIFGSSIGLFMPNITLWITEIIPSNERGRALGYLTTAIYLGQFLSPIAASPILDAGATLSQLFIVGAGLAALVSLLLVMTYNKKIDKSFTRT